MSVSLTKEQFLQRLKEVSSELKLTSEDFEPEDLEQMITGLPDNKLGIGLNLNVILGVYVARMIDLIYKEPQ